MQIKISSVKNMLFILNKCHQYNEVSNLWVRFFMKAHLKNFYNVLRLMRGKR